MMEQNQFQVIFRLFAKQKTKIKYLLYISDKFVIRKISFIILCIFPLFIFSQELPIYNQYILDYDLLNSATAGSFDQLKVNLFNRTQWIGMKDAPRSFGVNYQNSLPKNTGIETTIYTDKNGNNSEVGINATFTYHIYLNKRTKKRKVLSFGLGGMINYHKVNFSEFNNIENDLAISGTSASGMNFNARTGVFYKSNTIYGGISTTNLINIKNKLYDLYNEPINRRNFFFLTGYISKLNSSFFMDNSIMLKTTQNFNKQFDINSKIIFSNNEKYNPREYWMGFSYRQNFDVGFGKSLNIIGCLGFKIQEFSFGYAYEYGLTGLRNFNSGSHELMVTYIKKKPKFGEPMYKR